MENEIKKLLNENGDVKEAEKMAAYMKNMFKFAGIPKPELKKLITPILKENQKKPLNWDAVISLWNEDFREAQYVALEYVGKHQKELKPSDINHLKYMITHKSWWETVDTIDGFVGNIVLKDESLKETMVEWATSDNLWLRRVSIDFQQKYKEKTDTKLLEQIISLNLGSDEFFINKAIGWSLRDYSKVNPEWVKEFIGKYESKMAPLSIKEASKYI